MAALTSNTIAATYTGLLKTSDNGARGAEGSADQCSDGAGNTIPLFVSATEVYAVGSGGGTSNTAFGKGSGVDLASGGNYNTFFGEDAGATNKLGDNNIAIGYDAFDLSYIDDTQDALTVNNIFIGKDAGGGDWATAASHSNVGIGSGAMDAAMNGATYNIGIGFEAGSGLTTGDSNTVVGSYAYWLASTGLNNVVIGHGAMNQVPAGQAVDGVVAIGFEALKGHSSNTTTGIDGTVAIGDSALLSLTTGVGNVAVGSTALTAVTTGGYNTAIGSTAGQALTAGASNIALGYRALYRATTAADSNVAIGYEAMSGNWTTADVDACVAVGRQALSGVLTTAAIGSVAIGNGALAANTEGIGNVAIGYQALVAEDDGDYNTAIGHQALTAQTGTSGTIGNTAVGYQAGDGITTGQRNTVMGAFALSNSADVDHVVCIGQSAMENGVATQDGTIAIGSNALLSLTSGERNLALGFQSLQDLTDGDDNIMIGYNAGLDANNTNFLRNVGIGNYVFDGFSNANPINNVAVGHSAMSGVLTDSADNNVAIGYTAGDGITDGSGNTCLGSMAGAHDRSLTTGNNNTLLGCATDTSASGSANQTVVGYDAVGVADNSITLGNAATTALYRRTAGAGVANITYLDVYSATNGDHAKIIYRKSGNNTLGSLSSSGVVDDEVIGQLRFEGSDGDSFAPVASIIAEVDGSVGDDDMPGRLTFLTGVDGSADLAERMRITSGATNTGHVGINITSPTALIHANNETVNTDDYTVANNMRAVQGRLYYTGASSKNSGANDNHIAGHFASDFADSQSAAIFNSITGVYSEGSIRVCQDGGEVVYGTYNYAIATTPNFDIDSIYASYHNCFLESGGDVDVDVYGIGAIVDLDNAAVAGNVYGGNIDVDIESASAITGETYGLRLGVDDDDNSGSTSMNLMMAAFSNVDYFIRGWETENRILFTTAGNGYWDGNGDAGVASDYAEYFESSGGSVIPIGNTVTLENGKIKQAEEGDVILGVVRPHDGVAFVANSQWAKWKDKYLTDDYGARLMENHTLTKWKVEISYDDYKAGIEDETGGSVGGRIQDKKKNKEGDAHDALNDQIYVREYKFHSDRIPNNLTAPDDAEIIDNGSQRQKLNPDYDLSKEYEPREERDEWHIVGLLGQIPITKGQPVASNWIKMKDVSDTVEMYFVK